MKLVGYKPEAIYNRYAITDENDLRDLPRKVSLFRLDSNQQPSS
jgi:hypothetical protein